MDAGEHAARGNKSECSNAEYKDNKMLALGLRIMTTRLVDQLGMDKSC